MHELTIPMLANGMVMIWVEMLWSATVVVAGILAILALILAVRRRAGEQPRSLAVIALAVSFTPFLVLLVYSGPVSSYGSARAPFFVMLSFVPLLLSGASIWLTRRNPPGNSP
jgi:hypothetical protein